MGETLAERLVDLTVEVLDLRAENERLRAVAQSSRVMRKQIHAIAPPPCSYSGLVVAWIRTVDALDRTDGPPADPKHAATRDDR